MWTRASAIEDYLLTNLYIKSFRLFFPSKFSTSFISFLISIFRIFLEKSPLVDSISWFSSGFKASTSFITWSSIVFICFTNCFANALLIGEYPNLACSIIILWSDNNISSSIRNSYLWILLDYNADHFATSLLISYCSFSCLVLSSIVMIKVYILSWRLSLKREELSDARVVSITKNVYRFALHFL